ncbi:MAG: carboxylating nicotinate-nucleotide diphosphorylase [Actinobacteria bacterium]|nr:carboxylating nicotinate-nucleotide diphosphorylase [Actinomycetota bacterium]
MRWRWGEDEDDQRLATDGTAAVAEGDEGPPTTRVIGTDDRGVLATATRRTVTRALAEDLGSAGDRTALACIPATADGSAVAVAREPGVVAGTAAFVEVFAQVDPLVGVELQVRDGDRVEAGDVIAEVRGRLRSIVTAERTALNLLGRLSGVATTTRAYVDAVEGTGCVVRDTRKTTPGLRLLEKQAVAAGGGVNHRAGLHDALLVKDNHIAAAGGIRVATEAALASADGLPVQVEVTGVDELEQALAAGASDVLADNLPPDALRQLVNRAAGRARIEASGGITLETVRAYAETGVDRVSVGALTHSARTLDVALEVVDDEPDPSPHEDLFADRADVS